MLKHQPTFFSGGVDLWWFYVILLVRVNFYVVANWHVFVYCTVRLFYSLVVFQIQAVTDVA